MAKKITTIFNLKVQVTGLTAMQHTLEPGKYKRAMRKALAQTGQDWLKEAQRLILLKKSGRRYFYNGKIIYASKPGEPWADRSGEARKSLKYEVENFDTVKLTGGGDRAPYVYYLQNRKNVALRRPAMNIALDNVNKNDGISKKVSDELKKMIDA